MTDSEQKYIIDTVLSALHTNSMSINQLTSVSGLNGEESLELNGGRKVKVLTLSDALQKLSIGDYIRKLVEAETRHRISSDEELRQYIDAFEREIQQYKWLRFNRGEWSEAVAKSSNPYRFYEEVRRAPDGHEYTQTVQHVVYRYGCLWGCAIDKTQNPPEWKCKEWRLIEGEQAYRIDFESSGGWAFVYSDVDTYIKALIFHESQNVTEMLLKSPDVRLEWTRNTGNIAEDNTWQPTYVDGKKNLIHLTYADMGSGWGIEYRMVAFSCKVYLPLGDNFQAVTNEIKIKI